MTKERDALSNPGWLLSMPAVLIVTALALLPTFNLLIDAFLSSGDRSLTLINFQGLIDSELAVQAFWRTLRVAIAATILTVIAGYPLALMILKARPQFSALVLMLVVFPLMVSVVVRTYGWLVILAPSGVANAMLMLSLIHI